MLAFMKLSLNHICVNSIITQFGFAYPVCKKKLLVTHGYSLYGFVWFLNGTSMVMHGYSLYGFVWFFNGTSMVMHGYSLYGFVWFLNGTSMEMHVFICIQLGILLRADCMNYLEQITQDYFVILLMYHISNITLNVDLLSLLTIQPNHVTIKLRF